jgi:putative inorganic carbon (hco3(-)) transporter
MVSMRSPMLPAVSRRVLLSVIAAALLLAVPLILYASAEITLLVLVACVLGGIMLLKPEFTTLVVIFVFYTNLGVVAVRNGVPELLATSFFLLIGVPLFYVLVVQKRQFVINTVLVLMVVYLSFSLLSAALSAQPSATFSRVNTYLVEGLILYALILNCVRSPELIRQVIWMLVLAGGFIGGLSVYQGVTGDYENDFGGLAQISNAQINAGPESFFGDQRTVIRLAGPIGEKNRYAQIMIVLVPLAISRIVAERSRALRTLAVLCGAAILGGIFLTFSRGAGIALVVIFMAMAALRTIPIRYWLTLALGVPLLMLVFAPDYLERISTLSGVSELAAGNTTEADTSLLGRATENLGTLMIFVDHPILGVGPGQTIRYLRAAGNEVGLRLLTEDRRAHNMYLEELADTGILGFTAFIGILAVTLIRLWQQSKYWKTRNNDYFQTLTGLLLAVLAYMTTAAFLHLSYARYYWFLLAIAGAAVFVFNETAQLSERQSMDEKYQQSI